MLGDVLVCDVYAFGGVLVWCLVVCFVMSQCLVLCWVLSWCLAVC